MRLIDIATRAGVAESTVHRFETGHGGWRRDTDLIVEAYADELGIDWRDLWRRALDDAA